MEKRFEDFIEDAIRDMVSHRTSRLIGDLRAATTEDAQAGAPVQSTLGANLSLYEHCYREGLRDGIRLVGLVEQIRNFS